MGIFNRLKNMATGKVNSAIDKAENPIELLDLKIKEMEESLNNAKVSSAKIIGECSLIKREMAALTTQMNDFDDKVKLAMSKGNEELAKKALAKKIETEKALEAKKKVYEDRRAKADALKERLKSLEDEIKKTREYRKDAEARMNTADASAKVNEILANIDNGNNSIDMDSIERKIADKEAMANGLEELRTDNDDDNLEKQFEELEGEVDLDAELAKYKAKEEE